MAIFFSAIFLLLSQMPAAAATEFADADSIILQMRTTYFVNFDLEGQQIELELSAAQYQLLQKLHKLKINQSLPDSNNEGFEDLAAGINSAALKSFGKALVMKSENGFHLYRPIAVSTDPLLQILRRGVVYRGEEVSLTDRQTEIVRALSAAPNRSMTFQELAQAVGWNGRNYRTNVRSYMESINGKTFAAAGIELLQVEGRGKAIGIVAVAPTTYSEPGYSRVNGRIVRLDPAAFAVAEIISASIRDTAPSRDLTISDDEFRRINMTPSLVVSSVRSIYDAAGLSHERLKVILPNLFKPRPSRDRDACLRMLL